MNARMLPDITRSSQASDAVALDWVGMRNIALPLCLAGRPLLAQLDAGVSLDDDKARGIHMSRLYLGLESLCDSELTPAAVRGVLEGFLRSHAGLSTRANLEVRGELGLPRPALISPLSGWKGYPFAVAATLDAQGLFLRLRLELDYSSTCPCSAALSRELVRERFTEVFAARPLSHEAVADWLAQEGGTYATPHSQRSRATLELRVSAGLAAFPVEALLSVAEQALGTPVQTAVKRADEQAFARINGANTMFCEDAARRLHRALLGQPGVEGFRLQVVHQESLHAHDAVACSRWQW